MRAFQQRCWFFAVTSVTQGEILREKSNNFWGRKRDKNDFWLTLSVCFPPLKPVSVKICRKKHRRNLIYSVLQIVLWHLWQQKCKNSCDVRVRVRTREGCYRCFHNSNAMFPISVSRIGVFALSTFHWKQHVVFIKTTRRFPQNNTSFEEKERIVLWRIGIQNFIAHTASTLRGTFRNDKALKNVQKMGHFKENHYLCTK